MAVVMSLPTLSLSAVVFVLLTIIKRRYFTSGISDIPGPFLASISVLWQLYHIIDGHTEEEVIALHKKHGTFVRISHKEVSVSDPSAIQTILMASITKGDWYKIFSLPDSRFVNAMSECDPRLHAKRMKNIAAGYTLTNIMRSEKYVDTAIALLRKRFNEIIDADKAMEPAVWFNYFAFDVLGEVTFSKRFGFLEKGYDIGGAIANTRQLAIYVSIMGYLMWLHKLLLGNPLISMLNLQPNQHIFDTTMATIEGRRKNPESRKDMVQLWTERLLSNPDKMEQNEIFAAATANVGAGADTVSAALQSFFYFMIRSPRGYMDRLKKELDDAQAAGQLSDVVTYMETQNLPFLQACIKEAYRHHSPVGFGLPRVAPAEGITVAGRFFPSGTVLSVNPWVIHRNTEIFGEDADDFNPERWLVVDGDNKEESIAKVRSRANHLITFGAGYNGCPGKHLAHLEISKLTATLVRDFDFYMADKNHK